METLKCPECKQIFTLTKWQNDFINSSILKKMSFIMLECANCHMNFSFNPIKYRSINTSSYDIPRDVDNRTSKKDNRHYINILKDHDIILPVKYQTFLLNNTKRKIISIKKRKWELYTLKELVTKTKIDNHSCYRISELSGYVKSLRSTFNTNFTHDDKNNPFDYKRLKTCLSIGFENEDVLFIDPSDKYSIWCFYPDGGDVFLLENDFKKFINKLAK